MQSNYALTDIHLTKDLPVVSIISLKTWARRNLPKDHPLRAIIEVENEQLSASDFSDQIARWVKLAEVD